MSKPILKIANLSWQVGEKSILNDISFSVPQGQFVGVIGTNGSGKTSLLRTLYRYIKPSNGTITLGDHDIWSQSAAQIARQIAVVTQAPSSLPYRVNEVVAMGLTPHKGLFATTTPADLRLVDAALAQVDLDHLSQARFDTLSGGEQQRALIARATVQLGQAQTGSNLSQLLVMDEPTNHLDIHYQIDCLNRVKQLGTTVIASLHDLNIASAFCDQLILLDKGAIVARGTPSQVLTAQIISKVYDVDVTITEHPVHHNPHLLFHYQGQS